MSEREATAQQTDPLGALNQRPVTVIIALFGVALALGRSVFDHDAGGDMRLSIVAVGFVVLSVALFVVASSPYRAPFARAGYGVILVSANLGLVTASLASSGHDAMIRDDWGAPVVGLLLLACSPYRPRRDLLVGTAASAVVAGAVAAVEAPWFTASAPAILFVVIGVTPVVALGVASTVYSAEFVTIVRRWLERAGSLRVENAREMRPGIALSVQQDRVTGLNREVVPFFGSLVERGEVTEADRRRAGEVAAALREQIIAESDRSWLDQVLVDVAVHGQAGTVVDRGRLASSMDSDQRTAIRAIVHAMAVDPDAHTSGLGIVLHDDAPQVRALIRVESVSNDVALRQHYAPYFAVLRILFHDLQVDVSGSFLTLRFSYDQH